MVCLFTYLKYQLTYLDISDCGIQSERLKSLELFFLTSQLKFANL